MNIDYSFSTTTPSPPQIFYRNDHHPASDRLDSKGSILSSSSRRLFLRPLLSKLRAIPCSSFTFLRVSVVSAATRLGLSPPITVSSYVLWHLRQECPLPVPCRAVDSSFASGLRQETNILTGKHFEVSPHLFQASSLLPAPGFEGFKEMTWLGSAL